MHLTFLLSSRRVGCYKPAVTLSVKGFHRFLSRWGNRLLILVFSTEKKYVRKQWCLFPTSFKTLCCEYVTHSETEDTVVTSSSSLGLILLLVPQCSLNTFSVSFKKGPEGYFKACTAVKEIQVSR
jgi:hypothetical protein